MKAKWLIALVLALLLVPAWSWIWAQGKGQSHGRRPPPHEVTVLIDLDPDSSDPNVPKIEGIAADQNGNLYTVDSAAYEAESDKGRIIRVDPRNPAVEVLGNIPACARVPPAAFGNCFGVHFNEEGDLFIVASFLVPARILRIPAASLESGFGTITDLNSITYVSGVTGANGLAFDEYGFLFVGGSATGKIYLVPPGGGSFTVFNDGDLIEPFCRCSDIVSICPIVDPPPTGCNPQRTVANGVAFNRKGDLFVADTARGALWKIDVDRDHDGNPSFGGLSLFVQDGLLEGADGLTVDRANRFWVFANERNAVVRVSRRGRVSEIAQNDSNGPLEFPTGGVIVNRTLYISNFDNPRRDNRPNTNGIGASIAQMFVGIPGL